MNYVIKGLRALICDLASLMKNIFIGERRYNAGERSYIERRKSYANIERVTFLIFVMILTEITNFIVDATTNAHPAYAKEYLLSGLFLILVGVVYLVLISFTAKYKRTSVAQKRALYISFLLLVSIGSLMFSANEVVEKESLISYIILIFLVGFVPLLSTGEALLIILFSMIGQIIILIVVQPEAYLMQQCIILAFASFLFSQIRFCSYINTQVTYRNLKKANRMLDKLSQTDTLTKLLNRRGVETWTETIWPECISKQSRVALAVFDVDFFKNFNDVYGHVAGDECLRKVAGKVIHQFGEYTDFVSRYGGEEFIFVCVEKSDEDVLKCLLDVKNQIENLMIKAGDTSVSPYVTISIGAISRNVGEDSDFDEMYKIADRELFNAKRNGRNCVSFNGELYR